jgi:ribose 5-phosphate isomerase RpiB
MKIALINENSQAAKNKMIYSVLKKVTEPMGHKVYNYGMFSAEEKEGYITYVQAGLLTAILINSGAADYVITGCGTGEGAMLACNSFPKVLCGHVVDPSDAYLFAQINDGNAIALPFAKGFGWGGEINLEYIFEKLFSSPSGHGYPPERVEAEQKNKKILDEIKEITHTDMLTILENIDQDFLRQTVSGPKFQEYFFENCQNEKIAEYIRKILK